MTNRILLKLRSQAALAAASPQVNLRPLGSSVTSAAPLGLASAPAWYIAELPDEGPAPWDGAHTRIASRLGIAESEVLFAEPDLAHSFPDLNERNRGDQPFAIDSDCQELPQQSSGGRATGEGFAWHLRDDYSQLAAARGIVQFSDPRTRIAHIDTGYDRNHASRPERILQDLERNFVDGDNQPGSAADPNRGGTFDNSGHGTGTIGILAGRKVAQNNNNYLGGAPEADIVPLRIADSVVLFWTSTLAQAIQYATQQQCDVISLSMGGLPSRAWNEAINAAYEAGVCIVAAAGNSFGGLPTHHVVYPARYRRAIAACGVMADGRPYYDLPKEILQGNWGPESCMKSALAAYTPNIPWPKFGCQNSIDMDGQGTSSATPQVAAAVSLWYEKYKSLLPRDWRRVEAVRNALFRSAKPADPKYFGCGILQAKAALNLSPVLNLPKTPVDSDSFSFLRVLTGLGIDETPREAMFNLELTQRWLMNCALQEAIPDPEAEVSRDALRKFMEAVVGDDGASRTLRKHIASRYTLVFGSSVQGAPAEIVTPPSPVSCVPISVPDPPFRRIRAYAMDPSFSTSLGTASFNEVTLKVKWEDVEPGPSGEYIEVVDTDAAGRDYEPVDLNTPCLLAQDGFAPAEGNPGFHQQMTYAVGMATISHFERALGRPVLWRPRPNPQDGLDDSQFVRRLRIHPHALHQPNAYYSPQQIALLFGYFEAAANSPGKHVPGSRVYTCLSRDIIAHETTHAILDGMYRHFNEATNPDVLALHEAFADIVALMQHFTIPEILNNQISRTRGDLETESTLGSLAVQFGQAIGGRGALREAIGKFDEQGAWRRSVPDPADYQKQTVPHARGAILVAAVFDAFIAIYKKRTADLLRIYTDGTGVIPMGAIHPDLSQRLADEAAASAIHVLNICIRALDYIPPVDVTFGEYLRAIITADSDLVEDDRYGYRVAFVEAFRRRGIYPRDLDTLSVDTLRWQKPDLQNVPSQYQTVLKQLKKYADDCLYIRDRKKLFERTWKQRQEIEELLKKMFDQSPDFASVLGLDANLGFEVHELRCSSRVTPSGRYLPQIVAGITQSREIKVEGTATPHQFRGGATLIVDLTKPAIQYAIFKRVDSQSRQQRTAAFLSHALQDPIRALLLTPNQSEPFAALHSLTDLGGWA